MGTAKIKLQNIILKNEYLNEHILMEKNVFIMKKNRL